MDRGGPHQLSVRGDTFPDLRMLTYADEPVFYVAVVLTDQPVEQRVSGEYMLVLPPPLLPLLLIRRQKGSDG